MLVAILAVAFLAVAPLRRAERAVLEPPSEDGSPFASPPGADARASRRGGTYAESIAFGLEKPARVITGAAAIMIAFSVALVAPRSPPSASSVSAWRSPSCSTRP